MLGFFCTNRISGHAEGVFYSDVYDGGRQLRNQIYAILVVAEWSAAMTFLIALAVDLTLGLRVSEEHVGLDQSFYGESLMPAEGKMSDDDWQRGVERFS